MAGHQMPRRTKRRLVAAGIAASVIIGAGIAYGVSGFASARGSQPNSSSPICLPEPDAPAPDQTSVSAPPAETAPPQETAPPEETAL